MYIIYCTICSRLNIITVHSFTKYTFQFHIFILIHLQKKDLIVTIAPISRSLCRDDSDWLIFYINDTDEFNSMLVLTSGHPSSYFSWPSLNDKRSSNDLIRNKLMKLSNVNLYFQLFCLQMAAFYTLRVKRSLIIFGDIIRLAFGTILHLIVYIFYFIRLSSTNLI